MLLCLGRCPGRHLAMTEVRLALLALLAAWEWRLEAPLPPQNGQRAGLGVLPPLRDVAASARPRQR